MVDMLAGQPGKHLATYLSSTTRESLTRILGEQFKRKTDPRAAATSALAEADNGGYAKNGIFIEALPGGTYRYARYVAKRKR